MPSEDMLSLQFPIPRVPKNPVLGWSSFSRASTSDAPAPIDAIPSVLSLPNKRYVTSARVAIALALQRLGVGRGDQVLVPAYHCLSMVEPIVFCGAEPYFFPLTPTLEVPLDVLATYDLSRVRAILVTHYFGFPQAMRSICAFAKARGIPVIEDCAHAVFGKADGRPIGSWGDYAAVSLMKFFPVYDGGCLASATNELDDLVLRPPSRRFEAKALLNSIERGLFYKRFPGMQTAAKTTLAIKDAMWRGFKRMRTGSSATPYAYQDPAASEGVNGLDPAWLDRRISFASQQLVERLPIARIIARRRNNYLRLDAALRDLPDARPLFATLPDGVVPYVFPLLVERPERVFRRLKTDGVPLFRWERLWNDDAARTDPLSARYATEIFQLPCHQELTDDDLSWIIERVHAAFDAAGAA
ncbi:MAG: DegT/DnrJ/EryC1/StrS family aminotransferase [Burkholderiaceae bacterium]